LRKAVKEFGNVRLQHLFAFSHWFVQFHGRRVSRDLW